MFVWLRHFVGWVVSALGSRGDLILENLALLNNFLRCTLTVLAGD